ncbi:hypothetical protein ACN20G_36830 (plasmid) [Streptomyces sp. BI20]|uniref:hypothetical protein n=1 Tax=Streptomyces sp. BI20 TaxID=3403460 RepID=UPI003C720957
MHSITTLRRLRRRRLMVAVAPVTVTRLPGRTTGHGQVPAEQLPPHQRTAGTAPAPMDGDEYAVWLWLHYRQYRLGADAEAGTDGAGR